MAKNKRQRTLDRELKIYSVVAAGVLALAPSVEAAIHYSGLMNLPVNPSTPQYVDLNGDATTDLQADFKFYYSKWYSTANSWGKGPYLVGRHGAGHIMGYPGYCTDAIRLASNYQIKPALANPNFQWVAGWDSLNGTFTGKPGNCQGNFNNATGFLGVRFRSAVCTEIEGNYHYGWIQYRGDTVSSGTIIDWEYEDTCNTPIAAGANYHTYTSSVVNCNGNNPCFANIQDAIASATAPAESKITQETYIENINMNADLWLVFRGGWDANFVSNSSSYTTIEGTLTITDGMMILENIILK